MIKVQNLTKVYKTIIKQNSLFKDFFARKYETAKALKQISFQINQGELIGFVGPNGAGKTTTMKILAGILYPTAGEVSVLGYWPFDKKAEFLRQISFIMGQKNQLIWELPASDTFLLNKEIYEIPELDYKRQLSELTELLMAKKLIHKPVRTLSLGQRMRMELIAALLHKPKVMFLDEPTIGLDIFAQTTIINFIKEYQQRHQATIILTSHYMKDIQNLADRVILIDKGKLVFDGALTSLIAEYSKEKRLQVILKKPISEDIIKALKVKHEYKMPALILKASKQSLLDLMPVLLPKLEYSDFTLEDEPIEEVIKKVFIKS